jgi:uncharacterized protein YndB with AHSA1/START domain
MTKLATATRSLVVEREMPHPPEKIWRALTQAPLIEEWLMKNDFQLVAGHRFNFRAAPIHGWELRIAWCSKSFPANASSTAGTLPATKRGMA